MFAVQTSNSQIVSSWGIHEVRDVLRLGGESVFFAGLPGCSIEHIRATRCSRTDKVEDAQAGPPSRPCSDFKCCHVFLQSRAISMSARVVNCRAGCLLHFGYQQTSTVNPAKLHCCTPNAVRVVASL